MVIAGKIRGNAPQLGRYLFAPGNNEQITILHLDGREDVTPEEFKDFLYSVELNSELTRSKNSAYHAYINPNPEDMKDRAMTKEEWLRSVDILTGQLKYEDQRHGVVLHDLGNGRVHAHIVYERYNHERGTMATFEHNYNAHDRAREQMEKEFNHKPTPKKNPHQKQHKQKLSEIWNNTSTAKDFIREADAAGYKVAKSADRRPFRIVDENGVSFDLVKMIEGVNTKDIRTRLGGEKLMDEKAAIREKQTSKQERHQQPTPEALLATKADGREELRRKFLEQAKEIRERNRSISPDITLYMLIALRVGFLFRENAMQQLMPIEQQFVVCAQQVTDRPEPKPPNKLLGFIEAAQFYKPT